MNTIRRAARWAPALCVLAAASVQADGPWQSGEHTSRTYFGRGGSAGPYGKPVEINKHPWTVKLFGIRACRTPEEEYRNLARKYQIIQAKHMIALDRLNWAPYDNYMNPKPYSLHGWLGHCNSNKGDKCGGNKCGDKCSHGGFFSRCNSGCNSGCDKGSHAGHGSNGLHQFLFGGRDRRSQPEYPVMPPPHGMYPAMNPEDAVRYLEGFQYYPPNHMLRSPRDFFMLDQKYGLGR